MLCSHITLLSLVLLLFFFLAGRGKLKFYVTAQSPACASFLIPAAQTQVLTCATKEAELAPNEPKECGFKTDVRGGRGSVGIEGFDKAQLKMRQQKLYSPCRVERWSEGAADERSVRTGKPGHQIRSFPLISLLSSALAAHAACLSCVSLYLLSFLPLPHFSSSSFFTSLWSFSTAENRLNGLHSSLGIERWDCCVCVCVCVKEKRGGWGGGLGGIQ